jgi:hypothetical protein
MSEWLLFNANSAIFQLHYARGNINQKHGFGGVMVGELASSAVDRGFEPRSGQTKDYEIGICCFFAKNAALRRKSKDWLANDIFEN